MCWFSSRFINYLQELLVKAEHIMHIIIHGGGATIDAEVIHNCFGGFHF